MNSPQNGGNRKITYFEIKKQAARIVQSLEHRVMIESSEGAENERCGKENEELFETHLSYSDLSKITTNFNKKV
jgi:hypothetical protein